MSNYTLLSAPAPLGRKGFVAFLALQAAVLAAMVLLDEEGRKIAFWILGGTAGVVYVGCMLVYPWLVVPLLVGSTALDITGRLVKKTTLGIPLTGFHLALGLMFAALALNAFLRRRTQFPPMSLKAPLALLLGIMALSLTYSPNQPEATISFVRIFVLSIFLYASEVMIDSKKAVTAVVLSLCLAIIGAAVLGIVQVMTDEFFLPASFVIAVGANTPRAVGTFHNPNHLGTFLMVGVMLLFNLLLNFRPSRWMRLLWLASLGVGAAGLLATFSRANWLAAFAGLVVALWLSKKLRLRTLFAGLVLFVAGVALLKEFVPLADYIFERLVSIFLVFSDFSSAAQASSSSRVYFVIAGLSMFLDHPILGAGWRAFPILLDQYKPEGFPHWIPTKESHTLFANIIAELGLVGITAAVWIVWRTLRAALGALPHMQDAYLRAVLMGLTTVFIAFQVSLSFTADFSNNFLWMLTGMIFAVIRIDKEARAA